MKAILAKLDALLGQQPLTVQGYAEYLQIREALEQKADFETAWKEYDAKTQWVQDTATVEELGMHRADVLRKRIEKLQSDQTAAPQGVDLTQFRHPVVAWVAALAGQAKQQDRDGHAEAYNHTIDLIDKGKKLLALIEQHQANDYCAPAPDFWLAVSDENLVVHGVSTDDGNKGEMARSIINDNLLSRKKDRDHETLHLVGVRKI